MFLTSHWIAESTTEKQSRYFPQLKASWKTHVLYVIKSYQRVRGCVKRFKQSSKSKADSHIWGPMWFKLGTTKRHVFTCEYNAKRSLSYQYQALPISTNIQTSKFFNNLHDQEFWWLTWWQFYRLCYILLVFGDVYLCQIKHGISVQRADIFLLRKSHVAYPQLLHSVVIFMKSSSNNSYNEYQS